MILGIILLVIFIVFIAVAILVLKALNTVDECENYKDEDKAIKTSCVKQLLKNKGCNVDYDSFINGFRIANNNVNLADLSYSSWKSSISTYADPPAGSPPLPQGFPSCK